MRTPSERRRHGSGKPWTAADDDALLRWWQAGLHNGVIGRLLGRTNAAVRSRARELGLAARDQADIAHGVKIGDTAWPSVPEIEELARDILRLLNASDGPIHLTLMVHLLRGSGGAATKAAASRLGVSGAQTSVLTGVDWGGDLEAVAAAASSHPEMKLVGDLISARGVG